MYLNKEQAESLASDLLNKALDKLEPVVTVTTAEPNLNNEARGHLLKEISDRMHLINSAVHYELKDGIDQAEFARISTLTEPMEQAADYLDEASRRMRIASESFKGDSGRLADLANLAREIGEGEK